MIIRLLRVADVDGAAPEELLLRFGQRTSFAKLPGCRGKDEFSGRMPNFGNGMSNTPLLSRGGLL
jgi:hypothetical protein